MTLDKQEIEAIKEHVVGLMESLPIVAAHIGIRGAEHPAGESTPEEVKLMRALQKVSRTWQEAKSE